jgi:hypothetical protein
MPENIAIMLQSNQTSEGKEKYARVRFHTIQKSQQSEREKNMEELTTHLAHTESECKLLASVRETRGVGA